MKPLSGKRIVDFSRYAPGPYATLICAALGAEVIKIEAPPDGDPLRDLDRHAFDRLNAGKKSVLLDLKSAADRDTCLALVATADALVESFRPGVMDKLGLGYEAARSVSPSVVYVSISGFGRMGPNASRAGHDLDYMAAAGALHGVGRPLPLQVADFAGGGLFAVIAILSGLFEGSGAHVDLSMTAAVEALGMLATGPAAAALSGRYANYSVYRTKDGRELAVGALEPKFWKLFVERLGRSDLAGAWADPTTRNTVAEILETRDASDWEDVFRGTDACVETVRRPDEIARGGFALPFGVDTEPLPAAPGLGEHTDALRKALG